MLSFFCRIMYNLIGDDAMEKFKKILKEYLPYVIIIIVVLIIKSNVVAPIKVNGRSMNNTLKNGDIMILDIIGYRTSKLKRFEIIVIDNGKDYLIKRVIALPGEELEYKDNKLYINGKEIQDKYGKGKTRDFKTKVDKDSYFVLGDNREDSLDSRYYGAFNKKKILGKTSFTVFQFNRFGNKK